MSLTRDFWDKVMGNSLYETIHSWENLLFAYKEAAKGKRGKAPAAAFEYRLEENLLELSDEPRTRTYAPGDYVIFHIHEPKRRLISGNL